MYLNRSVDIELESWKNASSRKPLIIRGARQVGKSSSIRNLGKTFTYFAEVNFDENSDFKLLFEANNSIEQLCDELSLLLQTPIIAGETLLFLDEIQLCEAAINRLRYFYEKMPNLHVIAAGSLLEFALSEIPSFAVGRVRSLFMYPLSFTEFLNASGEEKLAN
jgi:predicted AAA+ superfamily ATPase